MTNGQHFTWSLTMKCWKFWPKLNSPLLSTVVSLLWANESLLWSNLGQLTDGSGAQHLLPLYSAAGVGVPPPPPSFLPISCAASVAHRPAPGALAHAGIRERKRSKVQEVEFWKLILFTAEWMHTSVRFYFDQAVFFPCACQAWIRTRGCDVINSEKSSLDKK